MPCFQIFSADYITAVSSIRETYLHGQLVAIGILTQLVMQAELDEAKRVIKFFQAIGLPTNLGDLGLAADSAALDDVVAKAIAAPFLSNMGHPITAVLLREAFEEMDRLGQPA